MGFSTDVLEVEVKDRFAKSRPSISRFLGKRKIQLSSLMHERSLSTDSNCITLPLSITDPCCGCLNFSLEIKKSDDLQGSECTSDPLANVANAAAASAASLTPSPDSITAKIPVILTRASLIQFPSVQRRKMVNNDHHNKVMSLARTCRRLSSSLVHEPDQTSVRAPMSMQTPRRPLVANEDPPRPASPDIHLARPLAHGSTPSPQKRANSNQSSEADDHKIIKRGRGASYDSTNNGTTSRRGAGNLHRQGAIGQQQQQQDDPESLTPRRPRSLTHQGSCSQQGFSLFGSVDSEQSVPRTAPLATPEQDMSLISSVENIPACGIHHQPSLEGATNDVFQEADNEIIETTKPNLHQTNQSEPEHPISFNVEITPPSAQSAASQEHGAITCHFLPDVVPKINQRLLKHRPSLISTAAKNGEMSSSLDTDSSSQADTPLLQFSNSQSTTAFPFHVDRKDSSSSGSVPNTPDAMEVTRRLVRASKTSTAGIRLKQKDPESGINIPRLPCLPERSTYPVELKNGETLPPSIQKEFKIYTHCL